MTSTEKKAPKGNRKDFVRTNISLSENIASLVILIVLVGIGIAIAIKGSRFDPDLYLVRTGSLDATAAPVVGKSQTVSPSTEAPAAPDQSAPAAGAEKPAGDGGAEGGTDATGAGAPPAAATGQPMEIALDGIKPMSDTEFYTADSLYEKIDGRAPAYQNFNVQQLRCRTFTVNAAAGSFVDVYEYRFDSPVDAFGMFSLERDPKGAPTDFAPDGYSGALGYYFRQGSVYVQIIASDEKPETLAVAKALAQNRAKELPADDSGLAGRRELPGDGMVANSMEFVLDNAQGQASLKNVYQAKYTFDGAQFPFFVMVSTPDDASKAWQSFQVFCSRFGKTELLPDVNGAKIFRAQIFGKWKVIYLRDKELGGVYDSNDADKARAFVEKYLQGGTK